MITIKQSKCYENHSHGVLWENMRDIELVRREGRVRERFSEKVTVEIISK